MIEVIETAGGWTWRLICAAGRVLVYSGKTFATNFEAAYAAKAYRSGFWAVADGVDNRQARSI